ncbi:MAG: hypothetical protein JNG90_03520 [Planctomycetaceae bacterium]|nr:hypothetical protein [Planctomycetaceae bacterium]
MSRHVVMSAIGFALLATLLPAAGWGAEGAKDAKTNPPAVPEGYLLIEDDVWFRLADEPDRHFIEARSEYLRNQPVDAAAAVLKATAMLKLAAAHAQGEEKKPLQASILELESLAGKLEHGTVRLPRSLDRIFARSFLALANYNQAEARRHLKAEEPDKASRHLRAASRDIVHAAAWHGTELEDHMLHALEEVEKAASRLLSAEAKDFTGGIQALDAMHKYFEKMRELPKAAE